MTNKIRLEGGGFVAMSFILMGVPAGRGIDSTTEEFLRSTARFGDRDLALVRSGGRVVKTPDTGIAREMVSVGATRFEIPFDYYVDRVRRGDLYRTGTTLLEAGRFSPEPSVPDMRGLTLAPEDLAALAEADPEAGKSEAAAKLFFVQLVRAYRNEGIRSLEALRQGPKRFVVSNEVRTLLANSPYLRHYGSHVGDYVRNYPRAPANGAEEYFAWAKVNIGLRRLVRLTKVTVWVEWRDGHREAVMVTEQLYATRYFQASLQADHVIADRDAPAVFLVTINHGRCDLLDSVAARLLRRLILSRTRATTERTLDAAKVRLESEYLQTRLADRNLALPSPRVSN